MPQNESRRRILQSLALTGVGATAADAVEPSLDAVRHVSVAHGMQFSDERLRVVKPIVEQRQAQLRSLRELAIDDGVGPTPGV